MSAVHTQRWLRVLQVFRGDPQGARGFGLTTEGLSPHPTRITIGQEPSDTFTIPLCHLPPAFALLRAVGDEFIVRLSPGMVGTLHLAGRDMTIAQFFAEQRGIALDPAQADGQPGLREQTLGEDDWGIVATEPSGAVAFLFQHQPPPSGALRGPFWRLPDPFVLRGLAFAAVIHLSVLALGYLSQEPGEPLALDPASAPPLLARIVLEGPNSRGRAARLAPPRREPPRVMQPRPPLLCDDGQQVAAQAVTAQAGQAVVPQAATQLAQAVVPQAATQVVVPQVAIGPQQEARADLAPPAAPVTAPSTTPTGAAPAQPASQPPAGTPTEPAAPTAPAPPKPPAPTAPTPPKPPAPTAPAPPRPPALTAPAAPAAPKLPPKPPGVMTPPSRAPVATTQPPKAPAGGPAAAQSPKAPAGVPAAAQPPKTPAPSAAQPPKPATTPGLAAAPPKAPAGVPAAAQPPKPAPPPAAPAPPPKPAATPAPAPAPPKPATAPAPAAAAPGKPAAPAAPPRLTFQIGPPTVMGSHNIAQVLRTVGAHRGELDACFQRHVPKELLTGHVTLLFSLDPTGATEQERVGARSSENPALAACLVDAATRWRFPPAAGPTQLVGVPLLFKRPPP